MKALVFIDHDIVCRHFVMSAALRPLIETSDVVFVFPDERLGRVRLDPQTLNLGVPIKRLPVDGRRVQLWRWALFADQLKLRPGRAERELRRLRRRRLGWKASLLLTIAGLPGVEALFRRWLDRALAERPNAVLTDLLDRERPDVIVHPSVLEGVFINDLVEESRVRGIPLVVVMNSWDNPSTKRAVIGQPDWLLVWGPQTYEHAVRFMHMPRERVVSFGAAQFDVFREPPRISRAIFAERHQADPRSTIILFAGSSARTDEHAALSALDQAIEDGRLPHAIVIYRPHPWGEGGRDGARLAATQWRHVRIHDAMRDYIARLASGPVGMTLPDYRDTNDLLSVIDVVVSPLSTILLEGMLNGKPVVVFAPEGTEGSEILANRLPQTHFEDFLKIPQVGHATTFDCLVETLRPLLVPEQRAGLSEELKRAGTGFVTPHDRPWGERFVEFLGRTMPKDRHNNTPERHAAE